MALLGSLYIILYPYSIPATGIIPILSHLMVNLILIVQ